MVSIPTTTTTTSLDSTNGTATTTTSTTTATTTAAGSSSSNSSSMSPSRVQIALDSDEERLFQILVDAVTAYEAGDVSVDSSVVANEETPSSSRSRSSLDVRVAGGWVRDKLLGLQTHDVDIAVDHLTGVQFATVVQNYLKKYHPHPTTTSKSTSSLVGRMGVIAANPAQSKHLETATMKVCGMDVDFCNLRSEEVYQEHSRIPNVEFGTPLEDALRRDFTINALFYNLRTRSVEDYTRRGIPDLMSGRLVTPLEPVQTFTDDPLRVLRAIRFAVRYNFALDDKLEQAAVHPEIHHALHIKVSRERVGKELEGMLSGKGANPVRALETISRLKLAGSVFCLPVEGRDHVESIYGSVAGHDYQGPNDSATARHLRELGWEESNQYLKLLPPLLESYQKATATAATNMQQQQQQQQCHAPTCIDHRLLPIAVFLLPFRELYYRVGNKTTKDFLAVSYIFRDGIKFKNKDVHAITTLMESTQQMSDYLQTYHDDDDDDHHHHHLASSNTATANRMTSSNDTTRLGAGMLLRTAKEMWVTSLVLATILKIRQTQQQQQQQLDNSTNAVVDWTQVSLSVYHSILSLELDGCWKMRPLLDGKAVIQALDLPRGPQVGTYLDEQVKWMLLNPSGTREECQAHLLSVKRRLDEASNEQDLSHHGISDGTGNQGSSSQRHFSKKMHVESMDLLE